MFMLFTGSVWTPTKDFRFVLPCIGMYRSCIRPVDDVFAINRNDCMYVCTSIYIYINVYIIYFNHWSSAALNFVHFIFRNNFIRLTWDLCVSHTKVKQLIIKMCFISKAFTKIHTHTQTHGVVCKNSIQTQAHCSLACPQ